MVRHNIRSDLADSTLGHIIARLKYLISVRHKDLLTGKSIIFIGIAFLAIQTKHSSFACDAIEGYKLIAN